MPTATTQPPITTLRARLTAQFHVAWTATRATEWMRNGRARWQAEALIGGYMLTVIVGSNLAECVILVKTVQGVLSTIEANALAVGLAEAQVLLHREVAAILIAMPA